MSREPMPAASAVVQQKDGHARDAEGEGNRHPDHDQDREDGEHQEADLPRGQRALPESTARAPSARSAMKRIQAAPASGNATCMVSMFMPVSSEVWL